MSEPKTIKIRFLEDEIIKPAFKTYSELISFIKNQYKIDDDKFNSLSIFYYDSDGDQISFQGENDYKLFIEEESEEKVIECEFVNKEKEVSISMDNPDPMKSGTIFNKKVPEQNVDLNLKNLDTSSLANSYYSIESLNNAMILPKKNNNKENDIFTKELNKLNNELTKTIEDKSKEDLIEKMKKQMDEMIKNHEEELKRREEENEKKYKEALAKKEKEMKEKEKKLTEDRMKKENEIKEKYENEMKSTIQLKEKEYNDMRSKIEIDNQKKLEEINKKELENKKQMEEIKKKEEESIRKLEELKQLEKENIKKIEEKLEEEKKK